MYLSRVLRTSLALAVLPAGLWISGFGTAEPLSAGALQQGRGSARPDDRTAVRAERCAVKQPPAADIAAIEEALAARGNRDTNAFVNVPVYWHIVTTASGAGNVSSLVPAQMQVLNEEYASAGFQFTVADVQVVANNAWFFAESGSAEEQQMKRTLRKGGPDTLNIYTTNGDVFLGWATLPFYYKFSPSYDGVVLWYASLPGGGAGGSHPDEPDGELTYDLGDTGTHEVGHWLGLDHTFGPGNGCTNPGDLINDTPIEAVPQFFCQARDTCVGSAFRGTDPITNFMDYTDDVCMIQFTSEQSKRMRKQWHAFRDKKTRE